MKISVKRKISDVFKELDETAEPLEELENIFTKNKLKDMKKYKRIGTN